MKTSLVSIGNSRGIRIPKPVIEQCGLSGEIDMEVRDGVLLVHAPRAVRNHWAKSFKLMSRLGDDQLTDPLEPTLWDTTEWQWK